MSSIAIAPSMAVAVHLRRCRCCCRRAVHRHCAFHRCRRRCRRVAIAPSVAVALPSRRPSPSLPSIVVAVAPSIAAVAVASPSPCHPCPLPCCPHPSFAGWLLHRRLHLSSSPVSCPLSSSSPPLLALFLVRRLVVASTPLPIIFSLSSYPLPFSLPLPPPPLSRRWPPSLSAASFGGPGRGWVSAARDTKERGQEGGHWQEQPPDIVVGIKKIAIAR